MRTAVLAASAAAALFFGFSFVLTFFARDYLTGLAGDYVAERTQRYAEPFVATAEEVLDTPGVRKALGDERYRVAREEVAEYRRDPRAFINRLVQPGAPAPDADRNAPLKERVRAWKGKVREYFAETLGRLLRDLRIFFGSNFVAALLAGGCAWRARGDRLRWLLGIAALLLAAVAYGAYMYVDGLSYFKVLVGAYVGWWYPAVLGMTFLGWCGEYAWERRAPDAGGSIPATKAKLFRSRKPN